MAVVTIRVNGREYQLACDDGQEESLRLLADEIDDRVHALTFQMKTPPGEGLALLLAALTMADELAENKKEIEALAAELKRLRARARDEGEADEARVAEMEAAMATTLEDIAARIEKIAAQAE